MDPKKTSLTERRERAAVEGRKALAEYEAHGAAARKNMERLRALRLEKEAADAAAALANPPPPKPAKKKAAKVAKTTSDKASVKADASD